ncbi:hypothetical protein F5Y06DRAFT_213581 [Hypoxylon sp. FL0890]|nr:hypothetical protein F5Y06DRAFT_213581 [Hypoxylon sp. FL0890]
MHSPELRVLFQTELLDVQSAVDKGFNVAEALLSALLVTPLHEDHLTRIQLGHHFRESIQSERKRRPHGLASVINSAIHGGKDTIEAKIFQKGGTMALVAYATAARDDRQVVTWMKSLADDQLDVFVRSISTIKAHPDFKNLVMKAPYGKTSHITEVPGPRNWRLAPKERSSMSCCNADRTILKYLGAAPQQAGCDTIPAIEPRVLDECGEPKCSSSGVQVSKSAPNPVPALSRQ